jgi:hypothetical protein
MIKQLLITALCFMAVLLHAQPLSRVFTFPENNGEMSVGEISKGKNGTWFAAGSGVGDYQIFITKFDADNEVLWSNIYDDRRGINFILDLPGNGNTLVFNNNQTSYFDASILEIDENGEYVSERIWGTEGGAEGWSDFAALPNKTHIILGQGFDGDTGEDFNSISIMDTLGNFIDEKYFIFENGNVMRGLIPDADGGFYAVGGTFSNELAIARYDEAAELLWAKMYAWPSKESIFFMAHLCPTAPCSFLVEVILRITISLPTFLAAKWMPRAQ